MASLVDLQLWQGLDAELVNLIDNFTNLIRAAHIPDEETEHSAFTKEKKAPGDLLEIWAEKLVYSGYTSLHILSQLKKGALLGDMNALVSNVRSVRAAFQDSEHAINTEMSKMKLEMQDLLTQLEVSYYSSQENRGRLIISHSSQEMKELCELALECRDQR